MGTQFDGNARPLEKVTIEGKDYAVMNCWDEPCPEPGMRVVTMRLREIKAS